MYKINARANEYTNREVVILGAVLASFPACYILIGIWQILPMRIFLLPKYRPIILNPLCVISFFNNYHNIFFFLLSHTPCCSLFVLFIIYQLR